MKMSDTQRKLRRWFRDHGWSTCDTPTRMGFCIESPVENDAGFLKWATDPKTGNSRAYAKESYLSVELDSFCLNYVTITIFTRKHWWKRDSSIKEDDVGGYTWVPSDDFEDWPRRGATVSIPAKDIIKMADLIKAAMDDSMRCRKSKNRMNFMERISKSCPVRWIGVNSSYDEIKWTYSNDRIRKERGFAAVREVM